MKHKENEHGARWKHECPKSKRTELTSGTPLGPGNPRSGVVKSLEARGRRVYRIAAGANVGLGRSVGVNATITTTATITVS